MDTYPRLMSKYELIRIQIIGSRGTNGHVKPENKLIRVSFDSNTLGLMIFYFVAILFQSYKYHDEEIQSNVYINYTINNCKPYLQSDQNCVFHHLDLYMLGRQSQTKEKCHQLHIM